MARKHPVMALWSTALCSSLAILSTISPASATSSAAYVTGTNSAGETVQLLDSRTPALFTGNFGDCMGGQSLINVTTFDAAYYADNMTVLFHLAGNTNLQNESVMIHIGVQAYGEDRFDLTFNPCNANFASLCPMNSSKPINGEAIIPVSASDVSGIPAIALVIPDFEGSATLRVFSNSTQTEIACFQAVMRNGASFSHPAAVSSVLGIFTAIAVFSSFATAIYGASVPHIRTHYAHSLSVLVVFEVFQSIFLSGALSVDWPSVLPAFWSNFAWSAGLIYTPSMIKSVNSFTGVSGNSSQVGGAGSSTINNNGGLQQQIYGRSLKKLQEFSHWSKMARGNEMVKRIGSLTKRATSDNSTKGYDWNGTPVRAGLPLPGTWSNFTGTLAGVDIPAQDTFLVGFLWYLILIVILVASVIAFKFILEALSKMKWMKEDRLVLFRKNWVKFAGLIVLRSMLIAFFMIMTLSLYQFSSGGTTGIIAIAAIIFIIFFFGILALAFYACYFRLRFGNYASSPDRIHFQRKKVMKFLPWYGAIRESRMEEGDKAKSSASMSFFRVHYIDQDKERQSVHQDEEYTERFGWLSARYRRTRWWFFAFWVVYQFVRACFLGGARANPAAQVFGNLVVEIIAFIAMIWLNPFEGARNTALAVYMLGISKVATAGLSVAFLPRYNVARIPTTVIGVIIIVIQGFLTIGLLILIVLGAISSYMSIMRNREEFRPRHLQNIRTKYFHHLELKAVDLPPPPPQEPEEPKEPYFSVTQVRRAPKIEDEDIVPEMPEMRGNRDPSTSQHSLPTAGRSRAASMRSQNSGYGNVPYGARVHRASWSSKDFQNWQQDEITRSDSPFNAPSRRTSAHRTANNSLSMAPLVRPKMSQTSLRPNTPKKEKTAQYADQRVGNAS
ncbi:07ef99f1-0aa5-4312-b734-e14d24b26ca4 [Sclerotinia trifoliorum]|uniref:07ef99f1-0aa5-4312-b734-e14d24b26ca4 n=1 Tax=Sclerotinia trifoliorum TaxID=28548 RepID=A0A8H2VUZ5_9HELO|nr:07ef99f1-0aa5-4312-b734-e14d24b26ca4 [Sclerotinia trifoliorum]